ncbi:MAG TPA: MlaD family protein [Verrucomicrobiae bacterium]|jgi:phospholipid/cholesterol/gamma-HCH transport system substrate-binding protein
MEKSRLELKVGLFVLIGLVLLAVLIIQFSKGTSVFRGTYDLNLHAVNVGGLKPRASVLLAGVQVGNVSDIKLADDGKSVTIFLKIYKEFKIYRDARFVIEQAGFLGDQYVSVIPTANNDRLLVNGDVVDCQEPFNLQEVARSASGFIQRIDDTAKKLDASVSDLQRVVLNGQTLTNFSVAVVNLRAFSEQASGAVSNINGLIATNGSQINLAVSNVLVFSQQLNQLANSADGILTTNGVEISNAVKNVESSAETLKKVMDDLQSGKGLAGTLLQNEQLATNVQAIANNLAIASSNLNRLGLWHFLWHREPAHTNESSAESH